MTETEWLACADPEVLLDCLRVAGTNRKLRLFACACARQVWELLTGERGREAVRTAERFADGLATWQEMFAARNAPWDERPPGASVFRATDGDPARVAAQAAVMGWQVAGAAARATTSPAAWAAAANAADASVRVVGYHAVRTCPADTAVALAARCEARRRQCDLLRDVFGNPFRPVFINPPCLTWNGGCIPRIAQAIYEDGRFGDLPVLADALEEAGCSNNDLLTHCREGKLHVRGCWAVDLLLDRR